MMFDRETDTRAGSSLSPAAVAQRLTADHEPPALEEFAHRIAQINESALSARVLLREFLGRCGRGDPVGRGDVAENAKPVGHLAEIGYRLNDLDDTVRGLVEATRALDKIG